MQPQFYDPPSNSCRDVSVKTTRFYLMVTLEEKYRDLHRFLHLFKLLQCYLGRRSNLSQTQNHYLSAASGDLSYATVWVLPCHIIIIYFYPSLDFVSLLRCSASTCLTPLSPCSWARTRRRETQPLPTVNTQHCLFNQHRTKCVNFIIIPSINVVVVWFIKWCKNGGNGQDKVLKCLFLVYKR